MIKLQIRSGEEKDQIEITLSELSTSPEVDNPASNQKRDNYEPIDKERRTQTKQYQEN
jgi:hypothetical protein